MESVGLNDEDVLYGTKWKNDIQSHSRDPRWWENPTGRGKKDGDDKTVYCVR